MTRPRVVRTALRAAVLAVVVLVAIELAAFAAYGLFTRRLFPFAEYSAARSRAREAVSLSNPASGTGSEVLHPYLGYVVNPRGENEVSRAYHDQVRSYSGLTVNEFGFLDTSSPIQPGGPDRMIVGIFGGSVAHFLSAWGADAMLAELRKVPAYAGKTFVVVRVAVGGYKQPQQLIALNYLLALGAHFDLVVNLDGFNEVVLPPAENIPAGVYPFYPRNWGMRVEGILPPAVQPRVARALALADRRRVLADWMERTPLRWEIVANLVWKASDEGLARALAEEQRTVQQSATSLSGYQARGPAARYVTETDVYRDLAAVWMRSSEAMHRVSEGAGIRYFHFLQPNQYVGGSKPLSDEERRIAFAPNDPYANYVRLGYPYLREDGLELARRGVRFHDLTHIFAGDAATRYSDTCCHLTKAANELLGAEIGRRMAAAPGTAAPAEGQNR